MPTDYEKAALERREAEMARGREIAARHAAEAAPEVERASRQEVLDRYVEGKKIYLAYDKNGNIHAFIWVLDAGPARHGGHPAPRLTAIGTLYEDDPPVASERKGPAFPSDGFIARCSLAVMGVAGMGGVPEMSREHRARLEERARRDKLREPLGQWKRLNEGRK
jgi:hypothetical protein